MKRLFSILIILLTVFTLYAQKIALSPIVYTLPNGLTVYLNPDPSASTVFGLVAVKAGSKNDPADATGMAHYQEHMLFKGTSELGTTNWDMERVHIDRIFSLYDQLALTTDPEARKSIQKQINNESIEANKYVIPNELDKLLKSIGSTGLNAFTSTDMTAYFNEFPPSQIEKWLEIYSHRFIDPVFRGFQAELEVVYEEYNMYNDMFVMPLFEAFSKNFFKNHPYGQQTTIGTLDHLKNPSLTKMYEFFRTYYVPNNMALIISGNFKADEVMPMIENYYSRWENRPVPDFAEIKEEPFKGRELVEVKMSPIKVGILGFRTVPTNHPDKYALDVMVRLLSNSSQTGVLDKLALDNQVMAAQVMNMPYKDHGAIMVLIIPKIIGQSLEKAEELVIAEMRKIARGEIDDELIEAIKKELYVEYVTSLESHQNVCVLLGQSFVNEEKHEEFLAYPERIMQINAGDIKTVAEKYIGENYLAFFSNMGFPKKEKIEKPGYEPIVSNTEEHSEYYKKITDWHTQTGDVSFNGYHSSIERYGLANNAVLHYVENPYNDIFTYVIRFYLTQTPHPLTYHAIRAMDFAGTANRTNNQLKRAFAIDGIGYSINYFDGIVEIQLEGMETGISNSMQYLSELMFQPVIDQTKLNVLYEEEKAGRKMETSDAESIADMLNNYIVYGKYSSYIHRPTLKEVKKLKTEELLTVFAKILEQPSEIHYTGSRQSLDQVKILTDKYFSNLSGMPIKKRYETPLTEVTETKVVFVHKKNTVQSKIFFYTRGNDYSVKEEPLADMFNSYFGGGFSGLVLKEIREFRSMAYSAGAIHRRPSNHGSPFVFSGYIGTQADKTIEAIDIFMNLVRNMPEKEEKLR
jgi:zinc protease